MVDSPPANAGDVRDAGFDPWVRKVTLEWTPNPIHWGPCKRGHSGYRHQTRRTSQEEEGRERGDAQKPRGGQRWGEGMGHVLLQ